VAEAQLILGTMYFNGTGVKKDLVVGYKWINLAAAQNQEQASSAEIRSKHL
jgi:TPR repeat protein